MPDATLTQITDALIAARDRGLLPTTLDSAGLRELGSELLARSFFSAHAANATYISDAKGFVDQLAAGDIGEGQTRTAIWEALKAQGYTPEGGFPDTPVGQVPPAVAGSLQDLSSHRRIDLIVRTQKDLMTGAGQQARGMIPEYLSAYPAYELIRVGRVKVARDWPADWLISGGKPAGKEFNPLAYQFIGASTGWFALKGDPLWGELGSSGNFSDALDTDHPPFRFNSGMGWRPVSAAMCQLHGITGPNGETPAEWAASRPNVLGGKMPLPEPQVSLKGVDPAIIKQFMADTRATADPTKPGVLNFSDILARGLAEAKAAYLQ